MSVEENYRMVSEALGSRKCTTLELESLMADRGTHCPDDLARTLNILRKKGMICGEVSVEQRGWVWWIPEK